MTFVIQAVEADAESISKHQYGCRVVQRLLEHCALQQLRSMLDQILTVVDKLAPDPYGNYVVQSLLERGRVDDKRRILRVVEEHVAELSRHKCSSNVVEEHVAELSR